MVALWALVGALAQKRHYDRQLHAAEGKLAASLLVEHDVLSEFLLEEVAGKDLRLLVENGYLIPQGEKRGRVYTASPYLQQIRAASRSESRPVTDPFLVPDPAQTHLQF